MSNIYHTFFFDPLYNALVFLLTNVSWVDAGILVIFLTIAVRLLLFPLSRKAVLTQVRMNEIAPQIEEIKNKYKDKPEDQARATLALYKEKNVNPFSGILVILIQIPIIFALYQIFLHFSEVRTDLLYSFIQAPESINTLFLGLIDISGKSIVIALCAALSTFIQLKVASMSQKVPQGNSFGDNLARSMQSQMKYVFPVMIFFIAYTTSGVIALYFVTTNLFSALQEWFVRRNLKTA